tara:strand:+ start:1448 stop:1903 length:456 start_codon:yes stop_codon:yes gene_type:complete
MSKNQKEGKLIGKTFESVNYTDWQTLINVNGEDRRVHFANGIDQRENGFIGGKYHTTDPDEIKSLENHPLFGQEIVLFKDVIEYDNNPQIQNDSEYQDNTVQIVDEVTTMAEASAWLKKNFDDVSYKEISNAKSIKKFIKDNNVSFPKLFK